MNGNHVAFARKTGPNRSCQVFDVTTWETVQIGGGNSGAFAAGHPASGPIICSANEPGSEVTETVTAGGCSLSYDATTDEYTYVWKTDKRWRGSCRMLVLGLNDGSPRFAKLQFR